MPRRLAGSLCLLLVAASGCFVAKDKQPGVSMGVALPSKFVHRGMTLVDKPVLQPDLAVVLPVADTTDTVGVEVEANIDLYNGTGNAWFPDGHGGHITQFEVIADYTHKFGDLTVRGGVHNYNLANGIEFIAGSPAGSQRGDTTEAFVLASMDVLEATPYFSWNYDFVEVDSSYYRGGLTEDFELAKGWKLTLDGSLGYAGSGQSQWMYGIATSGFADLRGEAVVAWDYDERTTIDFGLHGSLIVDSQIKDWFQLIGVDDDVIWVSVGMTWSF
ncbi:MAG TPA: hypothetical protein VFZ65_03855 [Planctomycetota bacterium]|nr:hypothetical protein [Planctomycetota bacterium]